MKGKKILLLISVVLFLFPVSAKSVTGTGMLNGLSVTFYDDGTYTLNGTDAKSINRSFTKIQSDDEFGFPTDKWYFETPLYSGSYSSYLTQNGKLKWKCRIDDTAVSFYIYEDGMDADIRLPGFCTVKIREENGNVVTLSPGRIRRSETYKNNVIQVGLQAVGYLDRNSSVSIIISMDYATYYLGNLESGRIGEFYFEKGPAGGYVFYDKGSYSDGWRYLEAAPSDLPESYSIDNHYGFYHGTEAETGTGKENTRKMPPVQDGNKTAAQACREYSINGFSDWFLPSKDELNLLYETLGRKGLCPGSVYMSSSEDYNNGNNTWVQFFTTGKQKSGNGWTDINEFNPTGLYSVRPIRAY